MRPRDVNPFSANRTLPQSGAAPIGDTTGNHGFGQLTPSDPSLHPLARPQPLSSSASSLPRGGFAGAMTGQKTSAAPFQLGGQQSFPLPPPRLPPGPDYWASTPALKEIAGAFKGIHSAEDFNRWERERFKPNTLTLSERNTFFAQLKYLKASIVGSMGDGADVMAELQKFNKIPFMHHDNRDELIARFIMTSSPLGERFSNALDECKTVDAFDAMMAKWHLKETDEYDGGLCGRSRQNFITSSHNTAIDEYLKRDGCDLKMVLKEKFKIPEERIPACMSALVGVRADGKLAKVLREEAKAGGDIHGRLREMDYPEWEAKACADTIMEDLKAESNQVFDNILLKLESGVEANLKAASLGNPELYKRTVLAAVETPWASRFSSPVDWMPHIAGHITEKSRPSDPVARFKVGPKIGPVAEKFLDCKTGHEVDKLIAIYQLDTKSGKMMKTQAAMAELARSVRDGKGRNLDSLVAEFDCPEVKRAMLTHLFMDPASPFSAKKCQNLHELQRMAQQWGESAVAGLPGWDEVVLKGSGNISAVVNIKNELKELGVADHDLEKAERIFVRNARTPFFKAAKSAKENGTLQEFMDLRGLTPAGQENLKDKLEPVDWNALDKLLNPSHYR